MEVTKLNFESVLSELPEIFRNAQFIAIDTEFTGLKLTGTEGTNKYDTPEMIYRAYKENVESFMVIQYGISAFQYNPLLKRYTHTTYNFYVYPSSFCPDSNFTCQASSMKFLSDSGFDFNKLFATGIPYIRDDKVKELLEREQEKFEKNMKQKEPKSKSKNSDKDWAFNKKFNEIISDIKKILDSNEKKTVAYPCECGYFRRKLFGVLYRTFGDKIYLNESDNTVTAIVGLHENEYKQYVTKKYDRKRENILSDVGFSKVIKLIIEFSKLIVGHNILMDLMFTVNQFIQKLPDTLDEFIELIQFVFPKILDTKYFAAQFSEVVVTNLFAVHEHFRQNNDMSFVTPWSGSTKNHDASYDAYLTGICFLAMVDCLGNQKNNPDMLCQIPDSPVLSEIMNKVSVHRIIDNPGYISLKETGVPAPDRSCVFYMTFPKETKEPEIIQAFQSCGYVKISWISNTSAYVCFDQSQLPSVDKWLKNSSRYPKFKLCHFSDRMNKCKCKCKCESVHCEVDIKDNNDSNCSQNVSDSGNSVKNRLSEQDEGEVVRAKKRMCT